MEDRTNMDNKYMIAAVIKYGIDVLTMHPEKYTILYNDVSMQLDKYISKLTDTEISEVLEEVKESQEEITKMYNVLLEYQTIFKNENYKNNFFKDSLSGYTLEIDEKLKDIIITRDLYKLVKEQLMTKQHKLTM
jgi:hypothetical protein